MTKIMKSRFSSICAGCLGTIRKGESIAYDDKARKARHEACATKAQQCGPTDDVGPDHFDMLIEDQMAERCGL